MLLTVYGIPLASSASSAFLFHISTPQNKLHQQETPIKIRQILLTSFKNVMSYEEKKKKKLSTYFRIAAGNPTLFVPRDVSKMKWSTFATVAEQ